MRFLAFLVFLTFLAFAIWARWYFVCEVRQQCEKEPTDIRLKTLSLTDGDKSGYVSLRNAATGPDWLVLELNERLPIEQINIETTGDCALEDYRILLNDEEDSEPPIYWSWAQGGLYVYGSGWTMVANVNDGGTSQTVTPTIGGAKARRMAIEFLSGDCGPLVGTGRHKITEIEVWAQGDAPDGGEPVSDGAPSCAAGNF